MESNCCGAEIIWTDICSECKEHCEPVDDEEETKADREATKGCDQYHAEQDAQCEESTKG